MLTFLNIVSFLVLIGGLYCLISSIKNGLMYKSIGKLLVDSIKYFRFDKDILFAILALSFGIWLGLVTGFTIGLVLCLLTVILCLIAQIINKSIYQN